MGRAKISNVQKQLEDFAIGNEDTVVDKLLVSVGTNDIRFCKNGINHLRGPLKQLCSRIYELFPNSKVYFQSLLPLPCKNNHDWNTNSNVINLNRFIFNECIFRKFYFMDAFEMFRTPHYDTRSPHIRNDRLFELNGIHPNTRRGMGVLAKLYLRALHSRFFNPCVFQ